jgi:hypothetical protein
MPVSSIDAQPVVTAFLHRRGRVLLLRRSQRVGSHRGRWAGISGYLERPPLAQARVEMEEEVGVAPSDARLRSIGGPLLVDDPEAGRPWLVFTFLFDVPEGVKIATDWESDASDWVAPEAVAERDTVPGLSEGLLRVWPPWGEEAFWQEMEAVALDTVHGATRLALRGLLAVGRVGEEDRRRALLAFASLHPSMGIFPHLAGRGLRAPLSPGDLGEELEAAAAESARRAAEVLADRRCVLTHSASSACRRALLHWWSEGKQVIATESRAKREGVDLARDLASQGLRVTVISDAAMGLFVPRCDAVLVGADAIGAGEQVINKVGTRLAVLAAKAANVPCYCVAQTQKIAPAGWPLALTPQDPADLAEAGEARVVNTAFDATPMSWFTAVLTERGVLDENAVREIARSCVFSPEGEPWPEEL